MDETTRPKLQWKPPAHLAEPGKVALAFLTAGGFKRCAQPFRDKMAGRDLSYKDALSPMEMFQDVGEMAVSASNLAFSVELHLKGLQMVGGQPGWGHGLMALYKALPQDLLDSIEAAYEAMPKPASEGETIALHASGRGTSKPARSTHSLSEVLEQSNEAFERFRYAHEMFDGKPMPAYEFHYLGVIADVLQAHADLVMRGI